VDQAVRVFADLDIDIKIRNAASVPDHAHELVEPAQLGIDPERLSLLIERVRVDVEHGPLPSAQLAVAREGRLVCFETFGDATSKTRYILQSVGRVVVASILWKLVGEGLVDVSERVADIVPSFGTNGKEEVTVEQIATHTAGLPFAPLGYPKMLDREQRHAAFSRWRLTYEPGSRLQWHGSSPRSPRCVPACPSRRTSARGSQSRSA
jgi:CubicO group peptidase (beta-lactamase class C family)